ncbi:MAG: hypothetical protein DWH73_03075 [Planctomycetota bacterium]|nr:MAG: hypothetical protein DWH73_03075 [Planctomycetota bacterium]
MILKSPGANREVDQKISRMSDEPVRLWHVRAIDKIDFQNGSREIQSPHLRMTKRKGILFSSHTESCKPPHVLGKDDW